jgi:hypothetical protein
MLILLLAVGVRSYFSIRDQQPGYPLTSFSTTSPPAPTRAEPCLRPAIIDPPIAQPGFNTAWRHVWGVRIKARVFCFAFKNWRGV